jgi:hypothetical protein
MQNLDYNTPGGKLNRGMSVVDTLTILKGSDLTEDEYFRAAALGWCVELVCLPPYLPSPFLRRCLAPSLLPRFGRYDGRVHYSSRSALLVPRAQGWEHCDQRLLHARGRDLQPPQEALPWGEVLYRPSRALYRRKLKFSGHVYDKH